MLLNYSFAARLSVDQRSLKPKNRFGLLPFPSPTFVVVDKESLGKHKYASSSYGSFHTNNEVKRGLMYTCHGGFIDLSHLRITIDYTAYWYEKIRKALLSEQKILELKGGDPSLFYLNINYPKKYLALNKKEKEEAIHKLALMSAQQLIYYVFIWHEMITWYGHGTVPGVWTQKTSAFTYEDMYTHILGIKIAADVLNSSNKDYDKDVTKLINDELTKLDIVTIKETQKVLKLIANKWYTSHSVVLKNRTKKRYLDLGIDGKELYPWQVKSFARCRGKTAKGYRFPKKIKVGNVDSKNMLDWFIEPRIPQIKKVINGIKGKPNIIIPQKHFLPIMNKIKKEIIDEYGIESTMIN